MHATSATRTTLARTGVAIDESDSESVVVSADPAQAKKLRALGYEPTPLGAVPDRTMNGVVKPFDFPSADSKYHNYAEMTSEISSVIAANPGIVSQRVIGTSYQGRNSSPSRSATMSAPTRASPRSCSRTTSMPAST